MKIKTTPINELIELSRFYGSNENFVLAGGGNTSVKVEGIMYVKASGVALSTISEDGFARVNLSKLSELFNVKYPNNDDEREAIVLVNLMNAREKGEEHKRPSVETLLHGLLPQTYVVHTHPAIVNGITCSKNGKTIVAKLFGNKALWIPYTDPGFKLAAKVKELIEKVGKAPTILFMENHGLIVSGDSPQAINTESDSIIAAIKKLVKREADFSNVESTTASQLAPVIRMMLNEGIPPIVSFETNLEYSRLLQNKESYNPLSKPFTPDHIVYCQAEYCYVQHNKNIDTLQYNIVKAIKEYKTKLKIAPKIVLIEKVGVFAAGKDARETSIALSLFKDSVKIAAYAESFGGVSPMNVQQISFITNWEVENYRKKVSLGGGNSQKRLHGKVAIVTGGAQGFGKGLTEGILREGAHVAIADRNLKLAKEVAKELSKEYGAGRVYAIEVDVSDDFSVKTMVESCTKTYGGIDLFVSNAGVLKAGSLESLTPADFELVTKVNYTAFFLCVRHASNIMKLQHKYAPDYWMDIVQINSKSGLSGSKANFAYAGGKFGGIGLTQSFALELVDFNIKVNAICPGNLFDGPLWSDPDNGLFVQYLQAKKVPGAKTIADVKKFYESKVPMKRGCYVEDVSRALVYVVEQLYETGQAIPVTGGQNMLR
jgi:rhamnose utilization protein RhaD (predicted bifunctional aldolase and dehydrogenase)/NAD(P)-dependent dehydrogenase (short-subunit alcohol dehydrogenase family)